MKVKETLILDQNNIFSTLDKLNTFVINHTVQLLGFNGVQAIDMATPDSADQTFNYAKLRLILKENSTRIHRFGTTDLETPAGERGMLTELGDRVSFLENKVIIIHLVENGAILRKTTILELSDTASFREEASQPKQPEPEPA